MRVLKPVSDTDTNWLLQLKAYTTTELYSYIANNLVASSHTLSELLLVWDEDEFIDYGTLPEDVPKQPTLWTETHIYSLNETGHLASFARNPTEEFMANAEEITHYLKKEISDEITKTNQ